MVRRGSTVRVRQRALQDACKEAVFVRLNLQEFQRAVGMEPFMELSDPERPSRRRGEVAGMPGCRTGWPDGSRNRTYVRAVDHRSITPKIRIWTEDDGEGRSLTERAVREAL
jgi:hypothetical protein